MINAIIASTSTIFGSGYLEYIKPELEVHFSNVSEIIFIPFARPSGLSYNDYTAIAQKGFQSLGKRIVGLHTFKNKTEALQNAKAIFTGGGNTFTLVNTLYNYNLIETLADVIKKGTPYLGTSAGSNICGPTLKTTNDMPIVYPPSFNTTGVIPFNINAHYLDPDVNSTHKGETRETRIKEFHKYNTTTVIGLREGSWLHTKDNAIILKGQLDARVFEHNKPPYEVKPMFNFNTLIP